MDRERPSVRSASRWYGTDPFEAPRKPGQARGIIPSERATIITDRKPMAAPERVRFDVPVERLPASVSSPLNREEWQDTASTKQLLSELFSRFIPGVKAVIRLAKKVGTRLEPFGVSTLSALKPLTDKVAAVAISLWDLVAFIVKPLYASFGPASRLLGKYFTKASKKVQPYAEPLLRRVAQFAYKYEHHIHRVHETFRTRVYRACYQGSLLLLVLVTVVQFMQPVAQATIKDVRYDISPGAAALIGPSASLLKDKLVFDAQQGAYEYNQDYTPADGKITEAGGGYQATLMQKSKDGITVTDPTARINIKLQPQFTTSDGKQADGRVVYPLYDVPSGQMIYTVKGGGLKEDLVLNELSVDKLSFSYKMTLPDGVIAKTMPDGSISIYSGDPTLFGNISYGSDADKARVEKARQLSPKDNLVFTLPPPVIKEYGGKASAAKAHFILNGSELTVVASGLSYANYPLSIDPTVTVNSAAGYALGTSEDNTAVDSSGALDRGNVTGGSTQADVDQTTLTATRWGTCTVVYNGRIYVAGGTSNNTDQTTVYMNTFDSSTGTLGGAWTTTNMQAFPQTRTQVSCLVYDGYFYAFGGQVNGSATGSATVLVHKINPLDGTLRGAWTSTGALTTTLYGVASAAYNGRIYVAGGSNGGTATATVQMTTVKGDGTLAAFSTTNMTALNTARHALGLVAANDHLYAFGGDNDSNTVLSNAFYAVITPSTGAVGAWTATTSMPNAVSEMSYATYNNYIYVSAGCQALTNNLFGSFCNTLVNATYYAQINADGTLGPWQTSNDSGTVNGGRTYTSGAIAPGTGSTNAAYFYTVGGCTTYGLGVCTATVAQVGMQAIGVAGWNGNFTQSGNALNTARYAEGVVAYNGYIYAIGGCSSGNCATLEQTVERAQIGSDGSIGAWTLDTNGGTHNMIAAEDGITDSTVVYNGFIYIVGGCIAAVTPCTTATNTVQIGTISLTDGSVTWTAATSTISNSVYLNMAVAANGKLYAMGGLDAGAGPSDHNNIDVATINSDGTLGAFSASTVTLPANTYTAGVAVFGKYIYLTGGMQSGSASAATWVATTDPTQTNANVVTSWTSSGTSPNLPLTMRDGSAFVNKGYLYVAFGRNGNANKSIYAAVINTSTGIPGTWNLINGVGTPRGFEGTVVARDYIYQVGGCESSTICTTISTKADYARLENGGSAWGTYTTDAGSGTYTAHSYGTSAVVGGYIFMIAGCTTSTTTCGPTTTVNSAPIDTKGVIGTWATVSSLGDSRKEQGSFVYNGKIYVLGGCNNGNCNNTVPTSHSIEIGTPNGTGGVTWQYNSNITGAFGTGSNLPSTVVGGSFVAYNGYVYRAGGTVGGTVSNTTAYAQIDSATGAIEAWTVNSTQTLNVARTLAALVAYNGYLYVVSGQNSTPAEEPSVEYTKIQNDHSLTGGWTILSAHLPNARHSSTVDVANGMLLVAGGNVSGTPVADVHAAAINADGTLGNFYKAGTLATPRSDANGEYYNGKLYVPSGITTSSATLVTNVDRGSLELQNRKGNWSMLADTDLDTRPLNLVYRGLQYNSVYPPISWTYALSGTGTACSPTSVVTLCAPNTVTGAVPETVYTITRTTGDLTRYYWYRISFDDTQSATFPDTGNTSYVSNFDMYFNAGTAQRLRNGKTFTGGVQNNLDAHP